MRRFRHSLGAHLEGLMHMSRFVMGTSVLLGVALLAANPGCSSSSGSGFPTQPGVDGGPVIGTDGSVGTGDGTVGAGDAHTDAPMMLGGGGDSGVEAATSHEGGFSDAQVMIDGKTCSGDGGILGAGPVKHNCIIFPSSGDDNNECDGEHDAPGFPPNGSGGNGFDDNCNGLVDEGCACTGVGTTKPCYLVPASQTMGGVPVGWCASNSKGTVVCGQSGAESAPTWSGTCRGAQPPYAADVCAPGDFNCDGLAENPPGESCACAPVATITCPTAPVVTVPYPPAGALPLKIDAAPWFSNPADVSMATNWSWSMTGGDCDNILPHPTFGIYSTANGSGAPLGTLSTTLGMAGNEHGIVANAPAVESSVYPAFSLSGDYIMDASWTLNGKQYTCSVQIEVRAPGLRAEGCWSTEGQDDDLDLHMAKVNGFTQCATSHAWSDNACPNANEDCFYSECASVSPGGDTVNWGYATSPVTSCQGWGSQTTGVTACGNPRLDRDANGLSGACDATVANPNSAGGLFGGGFCGPENINIDTPADGDQFAVGLRFYGRNGGATTPAKSHVNIYCDGARVLAAGYDPVAGNQFPQLAKPGQDSTGDMWKVALVTTSVTGGALTCTVSPTAATTPYAATDGPAGYCVDDAARNTANSQVDLTSGGGVPATANSLCYH
jgi:hypothetical protein